MSSSENFFDTEKLIPSYFKLALPVVFSMVVTLVYNLADTFFIARTNDALLVAGVSLCAPLFTFLMAIGNIYGQGGSSLIARLLGSGAREKAGSVSAFCFYLAILTGLVIAVPLIAFRGPVLRLFGADEATLSYAGEYYSVLVLFAPFAILSFIHSNLMRSEGLALQSMMGTVSGSLLNLLLDPVFISLLGWGARGAALATALGFVCTDAVCLFFVRRKSEVLSVDVRRARVSRGELGQILSVGITAAISNVSSAVCVIFINQFLLTYGNEKIAAMGIVTKVNMVVQLILVGFSFGGIPLFGYLFGAGEKEKLRELRKFCTRFLCGLALAESLVLFLLARPLMTLFIDHPEIIRDGTEMMRWQIPGMVFCAVVLLHTCLFQACGKARPALAMSLSRQGIVFVAVFLAATWIAGYSGFLVSTLLSDALSAVLALALYQRVLAKK